MHSCELIHKFTYQGKWCSILDGEGIQFAVVLYWSQVSILFLDEEEGECIGGL
jgi:hypothetical protein